MTVNENRSAATSGPRGAWLPRWDDATNSLASVPRRLRAASWDVLGREALFDGAQVVVHSVFTRAVNLVSPAGQLVGLVRPEAGNGPATVVLADSSVLRLDRIGLIPGMPVDVSAGCLWLGGQAAVDLRGAMLWNAKRNPLKVPRQQLQARLAIAERIAVQTAPDGGLAPLLRHLGQLVDTAAETPPPPGLDALNSAAWAGLQALLPAWRRGDVQAVERAATRLVGLGPGLTPSGDDVLAGLLVGAARPRPQLLRRELAEACLTAAKGRTTDLALARLRHATGGAIEEVQERVLEGLLDSDDSQLQQAVARAARWGHSSGVDTLVGLFLGIRCA